MKFTISKVSDKNRRESKEIKTLEELLLFVEDNFVKPEDRPLRKGEDCYRYSNFDMPQVIIWKENDKWCLEIYDDYIE